jgi:hypothetical protein
MMRERQLSKNTTLKNNLDRIAYRVALADDGIQRLQTGSRK